MALSKQEKSALRNKYITNTFDRINLTVRKGENGEPDQKDVIKAHAESMGESVNAFINRAIAETIERDNAKKAEAADN